MKKVLLFLLLLAGSVFAENIGELGVAGTGIEALGSAAIGIVVIVLGLVIYIYAKSKA